MVESSNSELNFGSLDFGLDFGAGLGLLGLLGEVDFRRTQHYIFVHFKQFTIYIL